MPSGVRLVEGGNMPVTGDGVKGKEGVGNGTMVGPCDNSAMARTGGEGSKGVNMKSTPTPAEANGEEQAGQGGVAAGGMALLEVDGGEGAVRERRNSIQERRKQRGQAGAGAGAGEVECRVLRLPVVRSESSPMLMLGRSADSSPGSAKSEPPSNQPSPRSPALKVLSKVFSFKDRPSPAWSPKLQRRGDGQGGRTLADARKRSSLHLPPTPPAIHDHEAKWFPDAKSGSPHTNGSPRSPSSPRSPLSPVSPGSKMARLPFFKPTTTASPGKASPGGPNGTMEQLDGAGIIYRPHAYRRAGSTRNHWRTKSDTFTQPPPRVEPVRKRSRDDSECDALPFDLRTKGVDGTHYLPRGSALDDRMRAEVSGDQMLDLLEKMAKYRIDDQRCSLPHPVLYQSQQGVREGPGKPPPDKEEPSAKASSRARLEKTLEGPPPYRQVVLAPLSKDYWDETPAEGGGGELDCTTTTTTSTTTTSSSSNHSINNNSVSINNNNLNNNNNNNSNKFETDESATYYRRFFLGKEHWNFYGVDAVQGPVLVSQRREVVGSQELVHLLVRLGDGLHHASLPAAGQDLRPAALVKRVKELAVERFSPVVSPVAPQLIVAYDEHALKHQFKFGLIVQRFGQTVEEQLFANKGMSPALEQFLSLMGRRVKLREHEGFKGGLDTQFGQTGEESVYEVFREKEVMFHVSTLLPYKEQDPQQLERKRHIGNDMVAVVFQEENTPFAPDMVASHFLHAYVVVMPIDPCTPNTRYKVSVTARRDVPFFGPTLPSSATFSHGPQFKEFLLTKLINAEMACYKASQFAKLEARTRSSLLAALVDDLRAKTNEFLGQAEVPETPKVETTSNRFKEIVAGLIGRSRSQDATNTQSVKKSGVTATPSTLLATTPLSVRSKGSGGSSEARTPPSSPDTTPNTHLALSESDDSSLNSDIDNHPHPLNEDSDTGLESMSSAETPHNVAVACPLCGGQEEGAGGFHANPEAVLRQVEALNQEINKLKCDKLDLLRQNVTCQRDIKKLKEKELKVGSELMAATKEITRLQGLLSEFGTGQVSTV